MLELLFLLLPVAVAYGWYMGRRSVNNEQQEEKDQRSSQYVEGINYLISEQTDKAVAHFVTLLANSDDAVDAHFALGQLFRQQGDFEKALAMHQQLLQLPLSLHQQLLAKLELSRDFMQAGLVDRAERILNELVDSEFATPALKLLLTIHEGAHAWGDAIKVCHRLMKQGDEQAASICAHYYCELGDEALRDEQPEDALQCYRKALRVDAKSLRAALALAKLWLQQGNKSTSKRLLIPFAEQYPDWFREIWPLLSDSVNRDELLKLQPWLAEGFATAPRATLALAITQLLANQPQQQHQFLLEALERRPSLLLFSELLSQYIDAVVDPQAKQDLSRLAQMVEHYIAQRAKYRCGSCGFSSTSLHWQCPSCRQWGTSAPLKGLDGE